MPYSSTYEVSPLTRLEIRGLANHIRKLFNIEGCYFPIVEFLEMVIPKLGVQYDLIGDEDWYKYFGYGKWAEYDMSRKTIYLRSSVYNRACDGVGQDRYTIAHEIAHVLLLDSSDIKVARLTRDVKLCCNPEWQADCFAGELLIPEHLCRNMSEEEIMIKCGVSQKAAKYQKVRFDNKHW